MTFSWGFGQRFADEFHRFPATQQEKILTFLKIFEANGFDDWSKYPGKISPSWSGSATASAYAYAKAHHLWHYHIGIPTYLVTHPKYKTSDWVLHFQWIDQGNHIDLVDIYSHHRSDGTFYLPTIDYLV